MLLTECVQWIALPDLLTHDMVRVGSCCSCVVCAVDCVADLLPHSIARCTCDEMRGCGVCAGNCIADLLPHDTTGCACDENFAEVHNRHCLVSDPLSPVLNSTLQEEIDWWLIDSGASVSVISEKNVRNYKSSRGNHMFHLQGSLLRMGVL